MLVTGLLVLAGALLAHARTLWFFGDDWDFLLVRSLREDPVGALLEPHNEHWSTIPVLAFRILFTFYGAGSYLPYAAMPIGAHLLLSALTYPLLRRAALGPWAAVLGALTVAYVAGGAGAENTLWDFQIGFLGSAAAGTVAVVALQHWSTLSRILAVAALLVALMSSGMGLVMTAWAVLYVLLRRGLPAAFLVGIIPAVVYIVWFLAFGRGHSGAPPPSLVVAPQAALTGLGNVWTSVTGMVGAGAVVLAVLAAVTLMRRHTPEQFALAFSGLAGALLCYLLIGYSRSAFGAAGLEVPRYLYFAVLMMGPAIGLAYEVVGTQLRGRSWAGEVSWVVAAALVCWLGLANMSVYDHLRRDKIQTVKDRLVAARAIARSGERLLTGAPDRQLSAGLTLDHLDGPLRGLPHGGRATEQARLDATVSLQANASPTDLGLAPATAVAWTAVGGVKPGRRPLTSCTTVAAGPGARLALPATDAGSEVRLTTDAAFEYAVTTARGGSLRLPGASGSSYVGVSAPGVRLVVFLQPGPVTVCPS